MSQPYLSYWEDDTWFKNIDITIVGSGIVGLSSAYFLKEKYPDLNILVVEKGILPHGATTRNAGFSCFGSPTEILSDIKSFGREKAYALVQQRFEGLNQLKTLHDSKQIGYYGHGGYEVYTEEEEASFEEVASNLKELNNDLKELLGVKEDIYQICDETKVKELGLEGIRHMVLNPLEGQLHSGNLVQSLLSLCSVKGIKVLTGLEVTSFENQSNQVEVFTKQDFSFRTNKLVVAVNGFAADLIPGIDLQPARGQVLVTKPISGLKLKGCFHHHQGFDYFRNVDNRVLIGGGRNLDLETEQTTTSERNDKIYNYLIGLLDQVVLPGINYEIEYEWSGIMGVGREKSPIIQFVKDHVLVSVRMGGMGVAIGTNIGKIVAQKMEW